MEITSLVFLAFVAASCFIYYVIPKKCQWWILLAASLIFFIAASALLTLYMLATTAIIYVGARIIQKYKETFANKKKELSKEERKLLKAETKKKQKAVVAVVSIVVLAVLVFTKYANFLGGIVNSITHLFAFQSIIPEFNILLPLGISYYTLMSVSYIVDVFRGTIDAEKNPLRLLLFVCYFPHIVEGPFDRYKSLNEQFRVPHKFNYDKLRHGIILVMFGFFKKLVIADNIGQFLPDIFENASSYSGTAIIMGTMLYTFQLYADFSGCINIVSGVSEMFGIDIAENFRQPFFSKTINEFWKRWHITLGLWLKDYVFYPVSLSGHFKKVNQFAKKHIKNANLVSFVPAAYALFFVWFCNGLWHGASFKYIVYGLYYYVLMMIGQLAEPLFKKVSVTLKINRESKGFGLFQILRTFIIVNIGMLIFRSNTLTEFFGFMRQMVTSINLKEVITVFPTKSSFLIPALGFVILLIVGLIKEKGIDIRYWLINHVFIIRWIVYIFLIFTTMVMGIYGVEYGEAAAIYAQF